MSRSGEIPSLLDLDEFDARTSALLVAAGIELTKARTRFAKFNSPHEGWAVIKEELDELWEHVRGDSGRGSEAFVEAVQTAAMALRYAYELSQVSAIDPTDAGSLSALVVSHRGRGLG